MGAVFKREFMAYFTTPIGYIFAAIFLTMSGALYWIITLMGIGDVYTYLLFQMFIFIIIIPILTMKLLSEEQKMKTDVVLLTAPVSLTQVILGKYFAALSLFTLTYAVSCFSFITLGIYGTPNVSMLLINVLGILFIGAAFIAIGMFVSSLTENQLVAAVVTIFVIIFFLVIGFIGDIFQSPVLRKIIDCVSFYERYYKFTFGMLQLDAIIYYFSFTFVFIFLTVRVCESRRWK